MSGEPHEVDPKYRERVRSLTTAKALAIAGYGESVAAYRYRTIAERTDSAEARRSFTELADEEQGHAAIVQKMMKAHFPDSDFVLTPEDKSLVIVGPRLLDVTDVASVREAMQHIVDSERRTGTFYATLLALSDRDDLKGFLKEMADECFEHATRLEAIRPDSI